MAGLRGFDGRFGRFGIANLADHDDIGILAQKRPQGRCEIQADLGIHLHLIDAFDVDLHRIFGGGDVAVFDV